MTALPGNLPDARLHSALHNLGDAVVQALDAYDQWWEAQPDVPEGMDPAFPIPPTGPSSRYLSLHVLRWLVDSGRAPSEPRVAAFLWVLLRDLGPRFTDRVNEDILDQIVPQATELLGELALKRQRARMAQPQPVQGPS
jgi:hypothetical protein